MSKSMIYALVFFAALGSGIYAAILLRVPNTWIVIGGLAANLLGLVVVSSYDGQVDPPPR